MARAPMARPPTSRRLVRGALGPVLLAGLIVLGACAGSYLPASNGEAGDSEPVKQPAPASPPPALAPDGGELLPAEIATVGWDGLTGAPVVLVRELASGKVVPIWVGISEARAIALALAEVEFPRPLTHDLIVDLLGALDARLTEVWIHDVRDGTYFGLLRLEVEGREDPLLVDTRPSDGMALALRTGALVRLSKKVLDETPDFEFMAPETGEQVVQSLGLTLVAPTPELRAQFGLPDRPGLVVTRAVGEAAEKGLHRGDLIVEVGGVVPESPLDFLAVLEKAPPREPIRLSWWRDGEIRSVELSPHFIPKDGGPKRVAAGSDPGGLDSARSRGIAL